ncbi:TPA: cGMP-dependent protein kinase [Trebouxia sp. C0005]
MQPPGHDIATLDQVKIDMSGPKAGRQRMAIAAEGAFANVNVEIVKATKSPAVIDLLDSATQNNLLFEHMLRATKQAIFDSMTSLEVAAGSTIIKQGDTDAKTFYVLGMGTCEVLLQKPEWGKEAHQVSTYESGSSFGELALLYSAPRAATVRAVTACQLWVMDRAVYVTLKQRHQRQMSEDKRRAVSQVPMLAVLSQEHKEIIAEAMEVVELAAGQNVYMQGDTGSRFYVIKEGSVTCTKTTDPTKPPAVFTLNAGQFFGERALLKDEVRQAPSYWAASVTAKSGVVCYTLARKSFDSLLGPIQDVWRFEALRKVPILFSLSNSQLFDLAQCMKYHTLQAGQIVFKKGEPGDVFYVVEEGNFTIYDDDENELARVGKGSCFGELALLRQDVRAANVRALSDSLVLTCHRDDFQTHLGRLTDIRRLWRFKALRKVPLLASLNAAQRSDLCTALKPRIFNAGESIVRKGEPGEAFYIVESGTCTVLGDSGQVEKKRNDHTFRHQFDEKPVMILGCPLSYGSAVGNNPAIEPQPNPSQSNPIQSSPIQSSPVQFRPVQSNPEVLRLGPTMYFGELALLRGEPRAATVAALTGASVLMLARQDFNILLGPLQMLLGQNAALYGPTEATAGVKQAVQLKELKKIAVLGAGAFGQVFLVKHGTKYYALKCLSKALVVETGLQAHVKREKEIQAECNSCFMVNLVASFKDSAYLYMLLECIMGGELFTYLQSRKTPCSEEQVRFYAAGVVSGLQYLQERNLVWRDLKPENLLLDSNGYLKMADFGFAKRLAPGMKTFTLCGTPEYLAPELVTQTGHARPVDWWAAGVLIFEMAAGYPPFYNEDRVAMFRNICQVKYTCPPHFSKELRDLVKRLLTHSPSQRLGSLKGGALDVKAHPWFKDFDWESFEKQTMPAPYIPKVSSPEDTHNFYAAPDAPGAHQVKQKYISTGVFRDF